MKKNTSQYRTDKRWTPKLMEKGFTPVADAFLRHHAAMNISVPEAMLLIQIMSYKWNERWPFPALTTLAERMGCSVRYVRKLCQNLESVGYLKRHERVGTSNEFDLSGLFTKLEQVIEADKENLEAVLKVFPIAELPPDLAQAVGA